MAEENTTNNNEQENETQESEEEKAKYTQNQWNKGMANKENEVRKEYKGKKVLSEDEYNKLLEQARNEGMKTGEERAKMSADEKAQAEFADKQKAIEEKEKAFQEKMDAFDRDRALANTKESLIDANLPKELAPFLTDIDEDKRTSNIKTVGDIIHKAVEDGIDERLKGKKTPENGSNDSSATGMPKSKKDYFALSQTEQQKLYAQDPDYVTAHFLNI